MQMTEHAMTDFYLVKITDKEEPLPNYGPYPTGPTAAYWAKQVAKKTGDKVMPRRVAQAPDWRLQQKTRFESGELKPLPVQWDLSRIDGHFEHESSANEFMIGYFANPAHAVMNKATEVKPGAYLMKFYPGMSENDRKRYAGMIDTSGQVFFASTPEEAIEAYENCPHTSCMTITYQRKQGRSFFRSKVHPVSVYIAGDLSIAYTKSKAGSVAERCLCWPDRKIYSRIYGDGSGRLGKLLMSKNFAAQPIKAFDGARLQRILVGDRFVIPYIDRNGAGEPDPRVRDNGEFLVIDSYGGTMSANSTEGLIQAVIAEPPPQASFVDELPSLAQIESILTSPPFERVPHRPITLPPTDGPTVEDYLMLNQAMTNNAELTGQLRTITARHINDNTIFDLGDFGT